ncbi:hypothetical protein GCM10022222_31050 [Amycolatopsis ultiminotia]|uniref:Uncharacterized protein n=1 Tax=Amycolatopsis ultiminotia TaxID=543629 RepID=A0ABP6W5Z3_9PSEU
MINNQTMFISPGTGLSVGVPLASRQGIGASTAACFGGSLRRIERTWTPVGITFAAAAAYPQVDVDLPTVKQFRVPSSLRERSS